MLVLGILLMLVIIGASITLSTLFKAAGAGHPMFAGSALVLGVFGMAATATFGVFRSPLWVPGFVGSFGALLAAGAAMGQDDPEGQAVGFVSLIFLVLFLLTGLGAVGTIASRDSDINSNDIAVNQK